MDKKMLMLLGSINLLKAMFEVMEETETYEITKESIEKLFNSKVEQFINKYPAYAKVLEVL